MSKNKMGIGDMAFYAPSPSMDLEQLLRNRSESHPDLEKRLRHAVENTGQKAFRFPNPWEDTTSLAANAAADVLNRHSWVENFRYLTVGSETAVDHSKPIASYLQGILQRTGFPLNPAMTTFDVKHACAGGTAALLSTAALLGYSGNPDEKALTVCSDISRYEAPSTAEITHGSGAVAMILEKDPRLLELDMHCHGYYASDVDDFFRPLDSVEAKVKGRYSMECYQKALSEAFMDYCRRRDRTPESLIDEVSYIAFHVPFIKMAETALCRLLKKTCGKSSEQVDVYLKRTRFLEAMDVNAQVGNLYNGSLYVYIMELLRQEYHRIGHGLIGRKILMASYGSGNTMIVFTATVCENALEVIARWGMDDLLPKSHPANFSEYLSWLSRPQDLNAWHQLLGQRPTEPGCFYLAGFNDAGLRLYDRS